MTTSAAKINKFFEKAITEEKAEFRKQLTISLHPILLIGFVY
jgi:hypothetical protein